VVEPMGNEIFIYARGLDHSIVARVAPQELPEPGQPITLAMDISKLHFFDAESERALGRSPDA